MAHPIFQWMECTDKTRSHSLERPAGTVLRLAQMTDPHVPGDVELASRLSDLVRPHDSMPRLSHELSAISNELGHQFRARRKLYVNLIKKALVGLRQLGVDHLVITGDLAHCGLPGEFLDMRGALEVTGWWGEERLTVVAGNHDRFNLYEHLPKEPMEAFFPVVGPRQPRFKRLPHGVVLLEVDSNRDARDDRHHLEKWLPNTVGRIYPEVFDHIVRHQGDLRSMRVVALLHHHITSDWYPRRPSAIGGLMEPADGVADFVEALELIDREAVILHGHKHDVMSLCYHYGAHQVGCPGGFAQALRINLVDFDREGGQSLTQIALRV